MIYISLQIANRAGEELGNWRQNVKPYTWISDNFSISEQGEINFIWQKKSWIFQTHWISVHTRESLT